MEDNSPAISGEQKDNSQKSISWTASEYIAHEKSLSWHSGLFAAAGVLIFVVYLIAKDILAVIVILMSAIAMSVYARKQPMQKSYEINSSGLYIDNQFYPFSEFRSFSIIEEGAIDSIWLKRLKRLAPTIVIYFPTDELDSIQQILENYLPFEERNLDLIDRATKRIRF